jgi:DNA-directed RNA polymerase subunit H
VILLPEEKEKEIDIFQSELVPKHVLINEKEKAALLHDLNINLKQLPRISADDPAIEKFGAKKGDVIKIIRKSPTAGECIYYRVVFE